MSVCLYVGGTRTTGTGYRLQAETIGRKHVLYLEQVAPSLMLDGQADRRTSGQADGEQK